MELKGFLGTVIMASVATVVVVSIAIPIIGSATIPEGTANKSAIESMLGLIPLLLVIAIIMAVLAVAIARGRN